MSIKRYSLVKRHNPRINKFDNFSPLSVGNGEIAFTADITGLQTFPDEYKTGIPLTTQSQWGWHTSPYDENKFSNNNINLKLTSYKSHDHTVKYPTDSRGQENIYNWLRQNPHKFHLGRIGFHIQKNNGNNCNINDIKNIEQTLDLWNGILLSSFSIEGKDVKVKTCCHPSLDVISFSICSKFLNTGNIKIIIEFPYGSPDITGADWNNDQNHATETISSKEQQINLIRIIDSDRYFVSINLSIGTKFIRNNKNSFFIIPPTKKDTLEFSCFFSSIKKDILIPSFKETESASKKQWNIYWEKGGIIELSESDDSRAEELERRIILSQYLTAIQCSGSLPSQETGLTCNSWYGKFHLEMHWWHSVHFALWERVSILERSMWWYISILPKAKEIASSQGYKGARWPKMISIEGRESPSPINPLIIWQQPHPIYYAEIIYRSKPNKETLEIYKDIVFESADFMASFVFYDDKNDRYILGAPIIPAQENHNPLNVLNPTFELEYWNFGLKIANMWKERLGLKPDILWKKIISKLASLPIKDGLYLAHEKCPNTFDKFNYDHPSMLAAFGMLPGYKVNKETMKRTIEKVMESWQMENVWGWDFPMIAMSAARLGMKELAVDALLYDSPKNIYLPNGHNRQAPGKDLPLYLPGNGGLLTAVGMMAAGWDNCESANTPGFPSNGKWKVNWENIQRMI